MKTKRVELKNAVALYKNDDQYGEKMLSYCICDENKQPVKYFDFVMDNDFHFSGHVFDTDIDEIRKMDTLDFEIDKDSIIYKSLKEFLNKEKSVLIDDDFSIYEDNKKTMEIIDEDDKIKMQFKNIKEKDDDSVSNRFMVFVKNIFHDGRSKIDQGLSNNNTKERLRNLFSSFDKAFDSKDILEQYLMNDTYFNELDKYKDTIFELIPELEKEDGFEHKHPQHCYDVWNHTVYALQKSNKDIKVRIALLLHDIGKTSSYQDDGDVRHFHGHPEKSAEMAESILKGLNYDEEFIKDVCYLIREHDTIIDINEVNENNIDLIKKRLHIQYCDSYAHNPDYIQKRIDKLDEIKSKIEEKERNIQRDNER